MPEVDERRVCFVIMGFGKKTDYETGKTFDLDATYSEIIRTVVEEIGFRCIRADEILHSGVIDAPMYNMLLKADLAIADISTGNQNAIYELGVRHALRPKSTIVMKENQGRFYFDINHINHFQYEHLGSDIGSREAKRARNDLKSLIQSILDDEKADSPIYQHLPNLREPQLSKCDFDNLVSEIEGTEEKLSGFISTGKRAISSGDMSAAATAFESALKIRPDDPYLTQQLALSTYKSKEPSEIEALFQARKIIDLLDPENSNDPETLGIAGAIQKNLWLTTKDIVQLQLAIAYYRRGYEVRRDYYNGENYAGCLELRSIEQSDAEERAYDRTTARKTRENLIETLLEALSDENFSDRSDKKWVFATLSNCYLGLGNSLLANEFEQKFLAENPDGWEVETFNSGKSHIIFNKLDQ